MRSPTRIAYGRAHGTPPLLPDHDAGRHPGHIGPRQRTGRVVVAARLAEQCVRGVARAAVGALLGRRGTDGARRPTGGAGWTGRTAHVTSSRRSWNGDRSRRCRPSAADPRRLGGGRVERHLVGLLDLPLQPDRAVVGILDVDHLAELRGGLLVAGLRSELNRASELRRRRTVVASGLGSQTLLDRRGELGLPGVVGDLGADPRGERCVVRPTRRRSPAATVGPSSTGHARPISTMATL